MNQDTEENPSNFTIPLMKNKKGLVMGVANNHSLAWGIANLLHKNGAKLAYTYQGESFKKRVGPDSFFKRLTLICICKFCTIFM